jgi:hypothetical protein
MAAVTNSWVSLKVTTHLGGERFRLVSCARGRGGVEPSPFGLLSLKIPHPT